MSIRDLWKEYVRGVIRDPHVYTALLYYRDEITSNIGLSLQSEMSI